MHIPVKTGLAFTTAGLLLVSGLAFSPCVETRKLENGLAGFRVRITSVEGTSGGDGSASDPYDYPSDEIVIHLAAEAYDQFGAPLPGYQGNVGVKVTPGELVYPDTRVAFSDGTAEAAIRARKLSGQVALWLEDVRVVDGDVARSPIQPRVRCQDHDGCPEGARCYEGICQREVRLTRKEGTWATGISDLVYFAQPRLRNVQWDPWLPKNDMSSLTGRFVDVDCRAGDPAGPFNDGHGQLLVTGIFNEGFYVTDLADMGTAYNHLYAYSYSYPENLEIGDRLDRLAGISQDFSGATQISFPTYFRALDEHHDPTPFQVHDVDGVAPPSLITTAMCDEESSTTTRHMCGHSKDNWTLEEIESARVRIENLRAPDVYIDCDFNGNLEITSSYPYPDMETSCRDACLARNGAEVVVRDFVASPAALADLLVQEQVICPWEASIPGIAPNCVRLRLGPEHICSELSTMRQFGQWVVALDDGAGPLINVLTRESLVDFDPTASGNLGMQIEFFQGNLRQVRAARPRWIVLVGKLPADVPQSMKP